MSLDKVSLTKKTTSVYVCEAKDLTPGTIKVLEGIDRVPTCVMNFEGSYYAFSGICTHKGGPLWEFENMKGSFIECPWHRAYFDIKNGRHTWPAVRPLRTFEVRLEGTSIYVEGGENGTRLG